MKTKSYKFSDIVLKKDGFLRGPFGSSLKKSLLVDKTDGEYKVYEQGVVLNGDFSVGNYYITQEYYDTKMSRFNVMPGDFLVSCSGVNYGAIYQVPNNAEKGIINQALLRIRLDKSIIDDNYFLYYFRYHIVKKITSGTGDSTIPNFPPMSFIKNIAIELPELEVQRKIGNVLKKLDEKIMINNSISSQIESYLNLIYNRWFLEFKFNSSVDLEYNFRIKREIPKGWKVESIYDNSICSIIKSGVKSYDNKEYLETANIDNNQYTGGLKISSTDRPSRANMQPSINSIWFAKMKNSLKHLTLSDCANEFVDKYILSTGLYGIQADKISLPYLHCFINSNYFEKVKDKLAHGATQEAINDNDLKNIKIVIPSQNILVRFSEITYKYIELENTLLFESKRIDNFMKYLIPLLMNGQVTINE